MTLFQRNLNGSMFRPRLQPPKRVLGLQILSVSEERGARIQVGKIVRVGLLKNVVKPQTGSYTYP